MENELPAEKSTKPLVTTPTAQPDTTSTPAPAGQPAVTTESLKQPAIQEDYLKQIEENYETSATFDGAIASEGIEQVDATQGEPALSAGEFFNTPTETIDPEKLPARTQEQTKHAESIEKSGIAHWTE